MANKYLQYANRDMPLLESASALNITDNLILSQGIGIENVKKISLEGLQSFIATNWIVRTYSQVQTLIANNGLLTGAFYFLSDRNIGVQASSINNLSIAAIHTREIRAVGWIQINSGDSGSVNSITVNGVEILSGSVSFNTDISVTIADVVNNINTYTSSPDYTALYAGARAIIFPANGLGSSVNSYTVSVSLTGLSGTSGNMTGGQDIGINWFNVIYDFENDLITRMEDNKGNIVVTSLNGNEILEDNPIDIFPWGQDNIFNNIVNISYLTAYTSTGIIAGNTVTGGSAIIANGYEGEMIGANNVDGSNIYATLSSKRVENNVLNDSTIGVSFTFSGTAIRGCSLLQSTLQASTYAGDFEGNSLTGAILNLSNSAVEVKYSRIFLGNEIELTFDTNQVMLDINFSSSNYSVSITISSNTVDLDLDGLRFAGVLEINSSATLNTINGLSALPTSFILKPTLGNTVIIDSSTATNITLPASVSTITINGTNEDFVIAKKNAAGTGVLITQINRY